MTERNTRMGGLLSNIMEKLHQLLYGIVIISFGAMGVISCNTVSPIDTNIDNNANDNVYQDFREFNKYPEEALFFIRAAWVDIDVNSMLADFCVIAERDVLKREPLALKPPPEPEKSKTNLDDTNRDNIIKDIKDLIAAETTRGYKPWDMMKIYERIKIHSVVFGDVPEKEFLISRVVDPPHDKPYYEVFWLRYLPLSVPIAIPVSPPPDSKNQEMILFGCREKADYSIGSSLWAGQEIISIQAIKAIKKLMIKEDLNDGHSTDVFQKEKQDLLDNSNNNELLSYLFRRCQLYGNISETVELIKRLSENNPSMPNRKFLSFGFSLYTLYDLSEQGGHDESNKWFLNESQKQILIAIVTKKLSEASSISEGLKYLRLIGMFNYDPTIKYVADNTEWSKEKWDEFNSPTPIDSLLFKKVPALKDNLKQVAQMLSKRFEDDKDYPEWQKWVNKIFPAGQTPKSEEGNK
ncbi:MAG TPA: hypothetical protein VJC37_07275 [Planctomycetota bacterium]|nr:hypothetical protein [Planctomycetota bacterium]